MLKNENKYGVFITLILIGLVVIGYFGNRWFRSWQYFRSFWEQTWQIDEAHTVTYKIPQDWSVETGDKTQVVKWESDPLVIEMMRILIVPNDQSTDSSLNKHLDDYLVNFFSSFKNFSIVEPLNNKMIDEYPAATVTVRAELFVTGDDMITNLIEKNGLPPPAFLEDYELTLVNYDELMILIIIKYRSGTPEIVPEQYSILKSVQESINFGKEPR